MIRGRWGEAGVPSWSAPLRTWFVPPAALDWLVPGHENGGQWGKMEGEMSRNGDWDGKIDNVAAVVDSS